MLTKYTDVKPKRSVNKLFENIFMFTAHSEIFSARGTKFRHIFKRSFFRQNYFKAH